MNIRILTDKGHIAEFYQKMVKFYLEQLLTPEEQEGLTVNVGFYSSSTMSVHGDTESYKTAEYAKEYTIRINRTKGQKAKTIAHELVHVKQMVCGDMVIPDKSVVWKGKIYTPAMRAAMSHKDYLKLPWEVEAFTMEKPLYEAWKASAVYKKWLRTRKRNGAKARKKKEQNVR